ncbi:polyketide synthase type I [Tepidicaulis marinus]|uniref:Polyketide synthase type I n=1 Tax=Tepidicaulis marinus TaxID=1333998 RepID=A0A081BE79_9HYPH|nr:polyketide synthase type I [Tepidicaulis marinus]
MEIPIANNSKNLRVAKLPSNEKELRRAIVMGSPEDWLGEAERAGCDIGEIKSQELTFDHMATVWIELAVSDVDVTRRLFDVFTRSRRVEPVLKYERPDSMSSTFLLNLTSEEGGLVFSECYYAGSGSLCTVYGQITTQVSGKVFLRKSEKEEWPAQFEVLACVIRRTILMTQQAG